MRAPPEGPCVARNQAFCAGPEIAIRGEMLQAHSQSLTEQPSATHRIYLRIRRMIVTGEIAPGEKLRIENLSKRLDSGTAPIREALSLLTSDQLVERIDQRGFKAAPASRAHFGEILRLRCVLDPLALREGIERASAAWEERLVLAHHRLSRSSPDGRGEEFEDLHRAFHMVLLENCSSPMLLKLCGQLYDLNIRYRYLAGEAIDYGSRDIAREHADLVGAVLDHDAARAVDHLVRHYQVTGRFLASRLS